MQRQPENAEWYAVDSPERGAMAGNDHDSIHAITLLSKIELEGSNVLGDKAYGTEGIRSYIIKNGIWWSVSFKSSSGFAGSPPDMTSGMIPSSLSFTSPPSPFWSNNTSLPILQTTPSI